MSHCNEREDLMFDPMLDGLDDKFEAVMLDMLAGTHH